MFAPSTAIADEKTGNIAFDEKLVKVGEEVVEALSGAERLA